MTLETRIDWLCLQFWGWFQFPKPDHKPSIVTV